MRKAPTLTVLLNRRSSWVIRLSNTELGASSSILRAVPLDRLRPSPGAMTAFDADQVAAIGAPGRLWKLAEPWKPFANGTDPNTLRRGWYGGLTSQNRICSGLSTTKHQVVADRVTPRPMVLLIELPQFMPPWIIAPRGSRALTLTSAPLQYS